MDTNANQVWKGVLIEESLDDTAILSDMHIVGTRTTTLEGEAQRGTFHFHHVEVAEDILQKVIDFIASHIQKPGWYFHLVKGQEMIIVFPNKVFRVHENKPDEIETAREYGLTQGIVKDQLPSENLFKHPFG